MERQKCVYRVYVTYIWNLLYSTWIPLKIRIIPLKGVMGADLLVLFDLAVTYMAVFNLWNLLNCIFMMCSLCGASLMVQWERIHLQCRRHWFIPGSGRSPGEGNGYSLQYYSLWNLIEEPGGLHSMELQKSQIQLSNQTVTCLKIYIYTCIFLSMYLKPRISYC